MIYPQSSPHVEEPGPDWLPTQALRSSDERLDRELADALPASDPLAMTEPRSGAATHLPPHLWVYRITADRKARHAFESPTIATRQRWTSPGQQVVYASTTPAGAVLEFLAHAGKHIPARLRLAVASVPAHCCQCANMLPSDWNLRPYREHVRRIGDDWVRRADSLVLLVPSALSPHTRNAIVNVAHQDLTRLQLLSHDLLTLDDRLLH